MSVPAIVLAVVHLAVAIGVSAHIVLTKDDVRSAIGWVGLVWLTPIFGSVLYILLGINTVNRSAHAMTMQRGPALTDADRAALVRQASAAAPVAGLPVDAPPSLHAIARLVGSITRLPLEPGCTVDPLCNGDEAYPAMLAAIDGATRTVAMTTYIFDRGTEGSKFVDALARAVARGVHVRVLIDGVGARYSHPPITNELKQRGVTVARFLPQIIPLPHPYFNLRNHRKMMVVDGTIGFCGGMNIRDSCVLALHLPDATQDLHFRLTGPVVQQIARAFSFDWAFTTKEQLPDAVWCPAPAAASGSVAARGIPDGPDADFETLLMTILGALSQARRSVRLSTPYFLPDPPLIDALRVAALRGVDVQILLPAHGNLRFVQWASMAQLPQVVAWGCRVYLSPPPFDHSKLLLIDDTWSLIGSGNLDPRSLRLNFEYNVECYSAALNSRLGAIYDAKFAAARQLTIAELDARPLPVRLRDGAAWLAQPYL
jgi:cardiolipin synthase A/B